MKWTERVPESFDGATLVQWLKKDGERIEAGDGLALFENEDGTQVTLPVERAGVVLRTLLKAGVRFGEGSPLAILGDEGEVLGWDPARVLCVRLTILRRCDECGNEYPVNGLVERARCTGCGDSQTVRPGFWQEYVAENVHAARTPGEASAGNILAGGHGKASITCVGFPPLCRKCYTVLDWEAVSGAWQAVQQGPTTIACAGCAEPHQVRLAPAWSRAIFPSVSLVVGETAAGSVTSSKPVVFKCPSCMAALEVSSANKRISHCKFCDSDIYLPDDLWLHFNPASKRGRWWMLLRP